jgi:hypothetical protein
MFAQQLGQLPLALPSGVVSDGSLEHVSPRRLVEVEAKNDRERVHNRPVASGGHRVQENWDPRIRIESGERLDVVRVEVVPRRVALKTLRLLGLNDSCCELADDTLVGALVARQRERGRVSHLLRPVFEQSSMPSTRPRTPSARAA